MVSRCFHTTCSYMYVYPKGACMLPDKKYLSSSKDHRCILCVDFFKQPTTIISWRINTHDITRHVMDSQELIPMLVIASISVAVTNTEWRSLASLVTKGLQSQASIQQPHRIFEQSQLCKFSVSITFCWSGLNSTNLIQILTLATPQVYTLYLRPDYHTFWSTCRR